jgi:hypothetical protein
MARGERELRWKVNEKRKNALLSVIEDYFVVLCLEATGVPLAEPAPFWVVLFKEIDW